MESFKQYIKEGPAKSWWVVRAEVVPNPDYDGPPKAKTNYVEITAPIEYSDEDIASEIEDRYPQYKVVDTSKYESDYDRSIEGE